MPACQARLPCSLPCRQSADEASGVCQVEIDVEPDLHRGTLRLESYRNDLGMITTAVAEVTCGSKVFEHVTLMRCSPLHLDVAVSCPSTPVALALQIHVGVTAMQHH